VKVRFACNWSAPEKSQTDNTARINAFPIIAHLRTTPGQGARGRRLKKDAADEDGDVELLIDKGAERKQAPSCVIAAKLRAAKP
jgi:hypothetical protein